MLDHLTTSPAAGAGAPPPGIPEERSPVPTTRSGKVRTAVLLWALGVPIPLVLLFLLIRGCMG